MEQVTFKSSKLLNPEELLKMAKKSRRIIHQNPELLRRWQYEDIKILKLEKRLLDQADYYQFSRKVMDWCDENLKEVSFVMKGQGDYVIRFLNQWQDMIAPEIDADPISWWKIISLAEMVDRFSPLHSSRTDLDDDLSKYLDDLPWPMALFDQHNQLILQNKNFSDLNILLSDCLNWSDKFKINFSGELFELNRKQLESGLILYFRPIKNSLMSNSNELGIVTSSLAHELNNPLAGIIAALDLAELLAEGNSSKTKEFQEMKETCWRCKELVELFLGFSKGTPDSQLSREISFASLAQHAHDLLRFRLFELNTKFEVNVATNSTLRVIYNPSVLTMIFYLIFSDFLTQFGHYLLVSSEIESQERKLLITLTEKEKEFEIYIHGDMEAKWNENPLVTALMEFDGMALQGQTTKRMTFTWQI